MMIFDELTRPGATWFHASTGGLEQVPVQLADGIRASTRITADEPWQWYWESEEDFWDFRDSQFGPMRMPFSHMWIEGRLPSRMHADGETRNNTYYASGAHLIEVRPGPESPPGAELGVSVDFVMMPFRSRPPVLMPASGLLWLKEDGSFVDCLTIYSESNPASSALKDHFWSEVKPAFLALSLMNCKNVGLEHQDGAQRITKKQRRPRPAGLDYHTIKLPMPTGKSAAAKRDAVGGTLPFHLVRGHFKTFTPEAPLMGQHVGTYWWGWQTRGNKKNGIVITDYEVSR